MLPASRPIPVPVPAVQGHAAAPSSEGTPSEGASTGREHQLLSESRHSPDRAVEGRRRCRPMLSDWLADVERQRSRLDDIRTALRSVRRNRRLSLQIKLARETSPPCSGAELGQAVLNSNRLMVGLESSFLRKQERRLIRLACTRELLTPQVLLFQAREEWAALQADLAGRLPEPGMHLRQEAVVGDLVDLMEALHPDTPLPEAQRWVGARVEELRPNRRRLLTGIDREEPPG